MGNEPLHRFTSAAMEKVREGQPIHTSLSHIQALSEPSFDDPVLVQLNWKDNRVKWYRTTWLRSAESYDFGVIGSLQYLHHTPKPTIRYENGEVDISRVEKIIQLIRDLSIKPHIDKYGAFTIDGCRYTLTIGVEEFESVYRWHSMSEQWQDLQVIADMLFELDLK